MRTKIFTFSSRWTFDDTFCSMILNHPVDKGTQNETVRNLSKAAKLPAWKKYFHASCLPQSPLLQIDQTIDNHVDA